MPVTARRGCCTSSQWSYVLLWSERRARRAPRARIAVRASARGGQGRELPAYSSNEGGEFNGSAGAARPTNPAAVACSACVLCNVLYFVLSRKQATVLPAPDFKKHASEKKGG
jgi:hypothetical protein